jgi:hypothetical protein
MTFKLYDKNIKRPPKSRETVPCNITEIWKIVQKLIVLKVMTEQNPFLCNISKFSKKRIRPDPGTCPINNFYTRKFKGSS